MLRLIVFWPGLTQMILAALVCAMPGLLCAAAQCGQEPVPHTPVGIAFQHACDARKATHYAEAVRGFQRAARLAKAQGDLHWQAKSQQYLGGCYIFSFQYVAGLQANEEAVQLARKDAAQNPTKTDAWEIAGSAEVSMVTIYASLGNFPLARKKADESIADLRKTKRKDLLAQAYLARSYQEIQLGDIDAGIASSQQSIRLFEETKNPDMEAMAWDYRGLGLLKEGRLEQAAKSMDEARRIYETTESKRIASLALTHLAELEYAQGQNQQALSLMDEAFSHPDAAFQTSSQFYPLCLRGKILRDLGRTDEALATFRKAVDSANTWRRATLPGDTTNVETVRELNETYQSFAELAAEQSLKLHRDDLAREALEALAQNRAASLREQLALDMGRNRALPADYLAKLGELQSIQARITLTDDSSLQPQLKELENEIAELETKIGLQSEKISSFAENNSFRNSLRSIQGGLGSTEVVLSLYLGKRESFLWSVTGNSMHLYRLPASGEIGAQAKALRDALEHKQNFTAAARALSSDLFSQLDSTVQAAPEWLIVGDGALLDRVPFAVLPNDNKGNSTLIQKHSIRLLPSELLLSAHSTDLSQPRFLGIADPLYNLADSRRAQQPQLRNAVSTKGSNSLGRLPGSQREIRSSAKYSGMPQTELLIGPDANITSVTAALANHPAIIHFAVHVVSPPAHPEQAALALSLGRDSMPELLTREKISTLRVPGSLVILSGCSSGQGQPVPSAGLIGLSRAWLLAGAAAVVVSNWPTPDDSGQFFTTFYSFLNRWNPSDAQPGSLAKRASSALQQAQLEMLRRGGYSSAPGFWAAYSIVSKE